MAVEAKHSEMKYVLITGGVLSGLGKGVTTSSLGLLLKKSGFHVTAIKIDPYLNLDAGTMSPYEHGECYVLDDGGEVDLDLGNYERFLDISLTRDHNVTSGKIYQKVISAERKGDFLGKTVQVVPHITNEIQSWIERMGRVPVTPDERTPDVTMIELGGTVGDIESRTFLEALRQFRFRVGSHNFYHVHVSLVPTVNEPKTKPIQHSVRELFSSGLPPDMIACRCDVPLTQALQEKIAMFGMVKPEAVISLPTIKNVYGVPRLLKDQEAHTRIIEVLRLSPASTCLMGDWTIMEHRAKGTQVTIGIVGKYTGLADSYLSITKALEHAASMMRINLHIVFLDAEAAESHDFDTCHGILVPGGFGSRGVSGKIEAIQVAILNKVPFLGICMGMQLAVVTVARMNGWCEANSEEFDTDCPRKVVIYMPEVSKTRMGGTMRLGSRQTMLQPDSLASDIYDHAKSVSARHRHRYEINPKYVSDLEAMGLTFSGYDVQHERMEIVELPHHPFFLGTQYHPEFTSRPLKPSPVFSAFINAAFLRSLSRKIRNKCRLVFNQI